MLQRLNILHLIEKNRLTTGSVVQLLEAARGLARKGHDVWVGSRSGGDLETACDEAGLPFLEVPLRGPLDAVSAARLRRHLRRHNFDILHVHKGRAHGAGLVASTGLGRTPRLVVNRGVSFPLDVLNKWKYRHPRVAAVICVADAVRKVVMRTTGIEPGLVQTIYGSTDTGKFDPDRIDGSRVRRELGLGPDDLVIGQVSVRDWKGWSDLVAAFAKIKDRVLNVRLLFVGCETEAEQSKVTEAARASGVDGSILTLAFRTDMPDVLASCDVVVDASWAGTGITGTIREAMAMRRAVVATDCGGNRELVIDGEVGLVVAPRDVDALGRAIVKLLDDPDLRRRLGATARKRIIDHFSTEKRIERLEALYRSILE